MDNLSIFKDFWNSFTGVLASQYNRNDENNGVEIKEDLIFETKNIFVKNTQQLTGKEFSSLELAEATKIVDAFLKS
ncbi:MAG: hypothetical protein LC111_10095 [Bacteroidia bacterium]|nr:hypothetical protein [Bacteroidia bacterium]